LQQSTQLSFLPPPYLIIPRMSAALPLIMAPDPSPNMTERSHEATGFFSLPRELRDQIYEMAWENHQQLTAEVILYCRTPIPTLRLASRQFQNEYGQKAPALSFLHISDVACACKIEDIPRLATRSRSLHIAWMYMDTGISGNMNLLLQMFGLAPLGDPIKERLRFLTDLVSQFTHIKDVHVCIFTSRTHDIEGLMGDLIGCSVITNFVIKTVDPANPGSAQKADLAIWSREGGFLVDNTDEEKAHQEEKGALERSEEREAAKIQSREVDGPVSVVLDASSGTSQNSSSRDGSVGEESP
jgi:hypothetical protein